MNIKHFSVFCFNRYFCLHFCLNKIESLTSRLAHMVYLFKIVPKMRVSLFIVPIRRFLWFFASWKLSNI